MKKKVLSIVLTLCLLLSLVPMPAMADGGGSTKEAQIDTTQYDTLAHAVDAANALTGPAEIQLLKDVTLMNTALAITNAKGVTVTSADDAQEPYTITRGDSLLCEPLFKVMSGGSLTLTKITLDGGSKENIKAEEPLIHVDDGGTLTLGNGATLQNNKNIGGLGSGGAVYNEGVCAMSGSAKITGNATSSGGGVYNYEGSTFRMTGGCIAGNTANSGGGVQCNGTVELSGAPVIWGNVNDVGEPNNLYLPPNKTVTLTGTLTAGARIGVTTEAAPTDSDSVTIATGDWYAPTSIDAGFILADDGRYATKDDHTDNTIQLIEAEGLSAGGDLQSGFYNLTKDLTGNITIEYYATVTLNLNGHKLEGTGEGSVITINDGATLNLVDSSATVRYGRWESGSYHIYEENDNSRPVDGEYDTLIGGIITGGVSFDCGGGVYNWDDGTFNMYGGSIAGNRAPDGGGGVYNAGALDMYGGSIAGNSATNTDADSGNGGGVYNIGNIDMSGGSITDNTAEGDGGGVYNFDGTFNMTGGTIADNEAKSGGGVFSNDFCTMSGSAEITGNTATINGGGVFNNKSFEVTGGSITGNKAEFGGGVFNNYSGSRSDDFTMSGGSITDNTADHGGGVNNSGAFVMEAGSITRNTATGSGGGVFNDAACTVSDSAEITYNTSDKGGGVYNNGTLTMSGSAEITGNTATGSGGGVYNGSVLDMSGGSITGNISSAYGFGGGVCNGGAMKMSGDPQVTDNTLDDGKTANNVHLDYDIKGSIMAVTSITLTGALTGADGSIGVSVVKHELPEADESVIIAEDGVAADAEKFASDNTDYSISCNDDSKIVLKRLPDVAKIGDTVYTSFAKAVTDANAASDAVDIKILRDIDLTGAFTITNPKGITITSAEDERYTIKRAEGFKDAFFDVTGTGALTLGNITLGGGWDNENSTGIEAQAPLVNVDNNCSLTLGTGAVLQDNNNNSKYGEGGGVHNNGDLTIDGGTITENKAKTGGGVYNEWNQLTIKSGIVSGNTAKNGGGVYSKGEFTMSGGAISGNTATGNGEDDGGGGVYNNSGTFNLSGGSIDKNTAMQGGGVFHYCGDFNLSDGSIEKNTASVRGGGVYMDDCTESCISMTGGSIVNNTAKLGGGVFDNRLSNYEQFNLSGNLKVTGNTAADGVTANNVYLSAGRVIAITGKLNENASVGVTTETHPANDKPVAFAKGSTGYDTLSADDAEKFTSDSSAYGVRLNNDQIELATRYTVTFDLNGKASMAPAGQAVLCGGKATAPAAPAAVTGYTFGGWYKEAKCENKWDFAKDTVIEATTLYAKWTANEYTVKFDANGGTGKMADEFFTYDAGKALTKNAFTHGGYAFDGWNTAKDGKGTSYKDGASVNLPTENDASVTLYAQWKAVKVDAGKVSGVTSQVAAPAPAAGATAAQKDAMQKATDALNASGVQASGLDKAVSVKKNANGDFTVDTGAKKPVTVQKTDINKIMGENHLTGASTLAAEPFLKIQVTAADVDDASKITTLSFDIKPYVELCLMSGGKRYVVSTELMENVTEPVTITLTLPDGFTVPEGHKIQVMHTKSDGTKYYYDVTRSGNQITFEDPNGFSTFTVQTVPISAKTGDESHGILWTSLAVAAACGAAYVMLNQRRKKKQDQ